MRDITFTVEMKKKIVLDFLRDNNNIGFSQGDLVRHLMTDLMFVSETSARVSISNMMNKLEKEGLVHFIEKKPVRGSILMKVWYLNEDIQEVSGKE